MHLSYTLHYCFIYLCMLHCYLICCLIWCTQYPIIGERLQNFRQSNLLNTATCCTAKPTCKKKKQNARETEKARERRYFEVYPGCLALANALFSEVEWHISSH